MVQLLNIAGGTALIVFGVGYLRKGLERLFGHRLAVWLERLAGSPLRAFSAGLAVSLVAPSSTTMSLLAVQTLATSRVPARNLLGVMLGANIGLTAMVLVVSLRLYEYAPVLLIPGVLLYQFTRRGQTRGAGQVILALAFIFMGVGIIKVAAGVLQDNPLVGQALALAAGLPWLMAVVAALMAVLMQSSTAVITMVMGLGAAQQVGLALAIPAVVGADLGVAVTTLLVGWANLEARRLSLGNLILKAVVALGVFIALPHLVTAIGWLPWDLTKQIAGTHFAFNCTVALVGLPLLVPVGRLMDWLVRPSQVQTAFGPRYLDELQGDNVTLALGQSLKEILRVSEIVRHMLADAWQALEHNDAELARAVIARDDEVDLLDGAIKRYLARLSQLDLNEQATRTQILQLRYLNELETAGDIIEKGLGPLAVKHAEQELVFTPEGWKDLQACRALVAENLVIAETTFVTRDPSLAATLLRHKRRLSDFRQELRDRHFVRLRAGLALSRESSSVHLDVLADLERLNDCICHVGVDVLQGQPATSPFPAPAARPADAPSNPETAAGD